MNTQTQTGTLSYPSTPTQTQTHPPTRPQLSAYSLDHVSDGELHLGTRRLVGRSNQILAALLAHLGEIEARGIHREAAAPASTPISCMSFACWKTPPSGEPALLGFAESSRRSSSTSLQVSST